MAVSRKDLLDAAVADEVPRGGTTIAGHDHTGVVSDRYDRRAVDHTQLGESLTGEFGTVRLPAYCG